MSDSSTKTRRKTGLKTEKPRMHKVLLLNDDYTPREFVVMVLKAVFHTGEEAAHKIMLTAHQKGSSVVAVYTREIAETRATEATGIARQAEYPLTFSTEPEE